MPHLDLDTSTFDACAGAARAAAGSLRGSSGLGFAPGASGDPAVEAALENLRHAWAADVGRLGHKLDELAAALTAAGRAFATAETDVVGALTGALGHAR